VKLMKTAADTEQRKHDESPPVSGNDGGRIRPGLKR